MKGSISETAPGKWRITYDAPPAPDGRRRQKTTIVRGTKKDAQRRLTELLHQIQTGTYVDSTRLTVKQYLEQWLLDHASVNCTPKTHLEYSNKVRDYVLPSIGSLRLQDLKAAHLVSMYQTLRVSGRVRPKTVRTAAEEPPRVERGLSERTLLHVHRILHNAFKQAVLWELLLRNPCDAVASPRPQTTEMRFLQPKEIEALLRVACTDYCFPAVFLAVSTGMRLGEICALRWKDIELQQRFLSVRRSLEYTPGAGIRFKTPKTGKSSRRIDLPPETVDQLYHIRGKQVEERLKLGPDYQDNDLVCCQPDGHPFRPDQISQRFRIMLRKANLPHVRFHDLRHSHATWLLESGVHPKVVQERLGHATIGTTLDIYSHVLPSMQADAARKIDDLLRAALGK